MDPSSHISARPSPSQDASTSSRSASRGLGGDPRPSLRAGARETPLPDEVGGGRRGAPRDTHLVARDARGRVPSSRGGPRRSQGRPRHKARSPPPEPRPSAPGRRCAIRRVFGSVRRGLPRERAIPGTRDPVPWTGPRPRWVPRRDATAARPWQVAGRARIPSGRAPASWSSPLVSHVGACSMESRRVTKKHRSLPHARGAHRGGNRRPTFAKSSCSRTVHSEGTTYPTAPSATISDIPEGCV